MFAVIQSGGKQYRVQEGDVLRLEKLVAEVGTTLEFPALLVAGEQVTVGLSAAQTKVAAEVVEHGKHKKIYINKYKSGIQYRRRTGHRQLFTEVKITAIG
ncbi:MAG: 50S ribosomal protein L21 [Deinococcaceae bacterium]